MIDKDVISKAAAEVAKAARKRQENELEELKKEKLCDQIKRSGYLMDLMRGQEKARNYLRDKRYKG